MNNAERRRDNRIAGMPDLELLNWVCSPAFAEDVTADEYSSFANMRTARRRLMPRQRAWVEEVARRVVPFDSKDAPRGREVAVPAVLQNLPKSPPGRAPR